MAYQSTDFYFDSILNTTMGVYNVSLESGMQSSPISGSKNIIGDSVAYNDIPYFYRTSLEVMTFTMVISPLNTVWDSTLKKSIFKWLNARTPRKFQTSDDLTKYCYAICTNGLNLLLNAEGRGYVELTFQAMSSFWFLNDVSTTYTLTEAGNITVTNLTNVEHPKYGGFYYEPEMWITMSGTNTAITLTNQSDGNRTFGFTGLTPSVNEQLYINNQKKQIVSSTGGNRIGNMLTGYNWFRLAGGINTIACSVPATIIIKTAYPIYK